MEYFLAVANRILNVWKTSFRWIALAVFIIGFFGFFVTMFTNGSPFHWLIFAIAGAFWSLIVAYVPFYAIKFLLINPLQEVFDKRQAKVI
ncbi:hypothetical protein D3C72_334480 [compost metagenome]